CYGEQKKSGDIINLDVERDDEQLTEEITLETFAEKNDKIGVGIQLVTDRNVEVDPEVHFSSGEIGGPSAGLMFSLEIYDQLTEKDLTKGYEIAGTGEVDNDGNVLRFGGNDKKVIAADRAGSESFLATNENGAKDTSYKDAQ